MQSEFSSNLAVLIGIAAYSKELALRTPVGDIEALGQLLAEDYGYRVWTRLDERGTASALRDLLHRELPAAVDADSRLVFYFAGHGIALDEGELEGPRGFLLPQDADGGIDSYLPMSEVHDALAALPCRHLLIILDCCFAGAFRWSSTREIRKPAAVLYQERYRHFVRHRAAQVITSSSHDETARDVLPDLKLGVRDESQRHSPFAFHLLAGLRGRADICPPGGDGVITASELFAYLQSCFGAEQTPRAWPLPGHGLGEFVFRPLKRAVALPRAEDFIELNPRANPYQGLSTFTRQEADLYFGRSAESARLAEWVAARGLTVVLGLSGTGKSSLVQAGLWPLLASQGPGTWTLCGPTRPADDPLYQLWRALRSSTTAATLPEEDSTEGPLTRTLGDWLDSPTDRHLLLFVDQLEESRIVGSDDPLVGSLAEILALEHSRIHIVVTLRSDLEPFFSRGPLAPYWPSARFLIEPLSARELREVIERPAEKKEILFESHELVDAMAGEVYRLPGALPLLSFTLSEIYQHYLSTGRGDRTLRLADYEHVGGIFGSIPQRIESEFGRHGHDTQRVFLDVMIRMTSRVGKELGSRRLPRDELIFPSNRRNQQVEEILDQLTRARLVVRGLSASGEPFVMPAHDVVIRNWQRLEQTLRRDPDIVDLQRQVARASTEWKAERPKALLWHHHPRFQRLEAIYRSPHCWLNRLETEFFEASRKARRVRRISWVLSLALAIFLPIALAVQVDRRNHAQRLAQIRRVASHADSVRAEKPQLSVLLAVEAIGLRRAGDLPTPFADEVLRRGLRSIGGLGLSGHTATVVASAISPDGRWLATGSEDGTFRLWPLDVEDPTRGAIEHRAHQAEGGTWVKALAFSPDHRFLVTAAGRYDGFFSSNDHSFMVWDLSRPRTASPLQVVREHAGEVSVARFSPDGRWLATGSSDRIVKLWRVGEPLIKVADLRFHDDDVAALVFDRDGSRLATSDRRGQVALWQLPTGDAPERARWTPIQVLAGYPDRLSAVAISPDLCWIANMESGRALKVYALCRPRGDEEFRAEIPPGHENNSLSISPDGGWLLTFPGEIGLLSQQPGDPRPSAFLWRLAATGPEWIRAIGDGGSLVLAATFSPDSRHLATGGSDRVARLWTRSPGVESWSGPALLPGHEAGIRTLSLSDRWLATGSDDRTARLWSLERPAFEASPIPLPPHDADVRAVAFSADGAWLATGSDDQHVRLWNTGKETVPARPTAVLAAPAGRIIDLFLEATGDPSVIVGSRQGTVRQWAPGSGTTVFTGCAEDLTALAVSLDRRWMAVGDFAGQVCLWSRTTDRLTPLFRHQAMVSDLAFSPDGQWLATASWDDTARLWPLDSESGPALDSIELAGHEGSIASIAFSAGGRWLVTGSWDDTARLWPLDIDQPGGEYHPLIGHRENVNKAGFSPDGKWCITVSEDATVRLWPMTATTAPTDSLELLGHSAGIKDFALTPDGKTLVTGGRDARVLLWNMSVEDPSSVAPIVLSKHTEPVWRIAVSDAWIASASLDDTVVLWPAKRETLIHLARRAAGRELTSPERREYLGRDLR